MPLNQSLTPTSITTGMTGHATLHTQERVLLEEVRVKVNEAIHVASVTGAVVIGFDAGTVKDWTLTGNVSLSFDAANVYPQGGHGGQPVSFTLRLTQDATGGRLVTWPSGVKWPSGAAPSLATGPNATNWVVLTSLDGGTTWAGMVAGRDVR